MVLDWGLATEEGLKFVDPPADEALLLGLVWDKPVAGGGLLFFLEANVFSGNKNPTEVSEALLTAENPNKQNTIKWHPIKKRIDQVIIGMEGK